MAVTETVKIVFEADTKAITDTTEDLVKLKKITQEEADALKKLGEEAKKTTPAIGGLGDELDHLGGSLPKVNDNVDNVNQSFVSLRTQVKQAKEEVQRAEAAFGAFSNEANDARVKAGQLVDKLGDMNRQLNLLNPEAKAKAFVNFGNNIVGAFQIATGALQAFGAENEQVQKIAMKLQGALNVAQGIASLKGLKESYTDLKVILGVTSAAQTTLNTTQTAGAVATGGLTRAFQALRAAMLANPFTAIAVAIGSVVGAMILLADKTDNATQKTERLLEIEAERANLAGKEAEAQRALEVLRGKTTNDALKRQDAEKAINDEINKTSKALSEIIVKNKNLIDFYNQSIKGTEREGEFLKTAGAEPIRQYLALQQNLQQIRETGVAQLQLIDAEAADKKKKDDAKSAEDFKKQDEKNIADAKSRREKAAADALKQLQDNQASIDAQAAATAGLRNQFEQELAAQLKDIDSKTNLEKLRNANQFFGDENNLKLANIATELNAANLRLAKLKEFGQTETDEYQEQLAKRDLLLKEFSQSELDIEKELAKQKAELLKKSEKERLDLQRDNIQKGFELLDLYTEIFTANKDAQQEAEIASLEKRREAGIISEEKYQEELRKIKLKGAEEAKKLQIFQATLNAAQAILSALATTYPDPVSKTIAVAYAGVVGALNLAKIIATPLPKFKDGTLAVPGVDTGQDSVMAMLRPGEAVIPTETNREYAPVIRAIYRRDINAKELNDFVTNREQGAFAFNQVSLDALYKRDLKVSAITGAGRTAQPVQPTRITADVDVQQLSRAIGKNKTFNLGNAEVVGNIIANRIINSNNPRR